MGDAENNSRVQEEDVEEESSPVETVKDALSGHEFGPTWLVVFLLLSGSGCMAVLLLVLCPVKLLLVLAPTLMGTILLLGIGAWFKSCHTSWGLSLPPCCSFCSLLQPSPQEDPIEAVKLCCCAISCTGPAVIMGGSIILLWVIKSYVAAATLSAFLVVLIVMVLYLDIAATYRCVECLKSHCCESKGFATQKKLIKSFMSIESNLGLPRLFLMMCLSTIFTLGSVLMAWVVWGSFNALWDSEFGYVPIGLIIFAAPLMIISLCLNCLTLIGCGGIFARFLRNPKSHGIEEATQRTRVYSADSFGESRDIQMLPPVHVVVE